MKLENYITLAMGNAKDKRVYELKEEDLKNYQSIGSGTGTSIFHCLYLANKYEKNFWLRVVGFRILKKDGLADKFRKILGREYIYIEFFEQK